MRGTVVRHEARRRWAAVLAVVAVLCALPLAVRAWPLRAPGVDPVTLRARIAASAAQPFHGYAQSSGTMGLPELPRLSEVTALLTGTTQLRAWYAGPDRWRVDVLGPGSERGLYRQPGGEYRWDFGDNQLTSIIGSPPVRLPRAADLLPPDLARRLLATATTESVAPLPARRVAGVAAAGLRIVPADRRTTVGRVDIWAAPDSGLPLQVEVTGRGAARPVLVSRFLEVTMSGPAPEVLTPPALRAGVGFSETSTPDLVSALDRYGSLPLPAALAGQTRRAAVAGFSGVGLYGAGLAQIAVLAVPGRFGYDAFRAAARYGRKITYPQGETAVISASLLSVAVVRSTALDQVYLVAGLVDPVVLQDAGAELAGFRP